MPNLSLYTDTLSIGIRYNRKCLPAPNKISCGNVSLLDCSDVHREETLLSRIRSWLPGLGLLLLILLVFQPLVGALPKGHDTLLHFFRISQLNALWSQGILFSRWAPDLAYGYGYPLFNYYPPLSSYLLTAFYWLANQNAVLGTSLSFALALALGCLGMYGLGNSLYRRWGGLLAAAAYTLAPHYLYQTYERGSLSTALVIAFYPWALWAVLEVSRRPTLKRIALAAVAILLVFASHTSASLLYLPIPLLLGLVSSLVTGVNRRARLRNAGAVLAALVLGLALSAWIWLPSLAEYPLTQYSLSVSSAKQLYLTSFADIWRWPGLVIAGEINPPLPQSPGLTQLALTVIATVAATATLIRKRQTNESGRMAAWIALSSALLGLTFAFFATRYALFFWQRLPFLTNLQYPWRFLDVATFCLALACGSLAAGNRAHLGHIALIAASSVVFMANALPYLYPPRWAQLPQQPTLADATAAQQKYGIFGLTSWGEYLPATATLRVNQPAFAGADEGASLAAKLDRSTPQLSAVSDVASNSLRADLRLTLSAPTSLTFATYYFPGWHATLDGVVLPMRADANGFITLDLPAGEHSLTLAFGETPLRLASDVLSVLALLGVLAALLVRPKRSAEIAMPLHAAPERYPAVAWLVPGVLVALLVGKLVYFDRADTLLVLHETNGRLPRISAPVGVASSEINLIGSLLNATNLTLFWQAHASTTANYSVLVSLVDITGAVGAQVKRQHPGYSPTSYWEPGYLVRDDYILPFDKLAHSGLYQVLVSLQPPLSTTLATREVITLTIGTISVPPAAIANKMHVLFADVIALNAVEFPASVPANGLINLTLDWRALASIEVDYTVFIHLLNLDGSLAITGDAPPFQGAYPTSLWETGQTFSDKHSFSAPALPGIYELEVGWYLASSGKRLAPQGPGTTTTASVILGPIEVTEPTP